MLELAELVRLIIRVLSLLILVRVILSWVPGLGYGHPLVQIVHQITAPVLDPIRRVMPPVGGLDLSPIIAILLLQMVGNLLVGVLASL